MTSLNKFNWYLNRLRSMGLEELSYRVQQMGAVYREKWLGSPKQTELTSIESAWDAFNVESQTVFFFSHLEKNEISSWYAEKFPQGNEVLLLRADQYLEDKVTLFERQFQLSIDTYWFQDPQTKKVWPQNEFWGDIDIRDGRSIGGVKWVWELNRHHHIVTLAKAFFVTGREAYAQKACTLLESWIDQNPAGKGVNWTSSLELGLRLINWSWALAFLRGSDALKRPLFAKINRAVSSQASHISRHLSKFSSANNHLIGEAAGLVFAGICFPWLAQSSTWRDLGLTIMSHELPLQILEDGVPAEQATQYFTFMLDFNLHVWRLAELNQFPVPDCWVARTKNAARFLSAMLSQDGRWIPIGDCDNAWVVRLDERGEKTRLSSFIASFGLLHLQSPAFVDEKTFWLFGDSALKAIPREINNDSSVLFPKGGYAVLRAENVVATADFGPLGYLATAAHGHADALSFALMVNERPFLIDPNTYAFQEGYEWRDYFRSTAAHNTISVDGLDQSEMRGAFLWGERANSRLIHWESSKSFDLLVAEHDGYEKLGVIHRRSIYFAKPNIFVILDYLYGDKIHKIAQFWHFPNAAKITRSENVFFVKVEDETAVIKLDSKKAQAMSIVEGQDNPIQGWDSPHYGHKVSAPVIERTLETSLPLTLETQILLQSDDISSDVNIPADIMQTVNRYLVG